MVSRTTIRVGVLLVATIGIMTMFAGPVVAEDHCDMDGFCEDDGEDDPYYDGPNPDIGGNVSDFIGGLVDPGNVPSSPVP